MKRISKEQIAYARKWNSYKKNPIKFFEQQCYLPMAGGDQLVKLHKPQKKIIEDMYFNNIHNMIFLKSRQIGFSTLFQLICAHLLLFYKNVVIGVTSKSGPEASDFARKTRDILDKINPQFKRPYKWCNTQDFALTGTNSQLYSSAVSPVNPGGLFRGKSITFLVIDEIAHISKVMDAWTGVAPALSAAQRVASSKGIPYGTILLSTPNRATGIGKFFFDMWNGAMSGENGFDYYRVHWSEVEEYKNDPEWYPNQCRMLNNDARRIQQELELQFVGDENTFLPEDTVRLLQQMNVEPHSKFRMKEGGELWTFNKEIDKSRFYLIGVDISSSYGNDYSAIEVMDYITMEQVMEYKGKTTPKKLAGVVRHIHAHCPKNLIIVENSGGYGLGVLNDLMDDRYIKYNIFHEHRRTDPSKQRIPGVNTNSFTRPLMMNALYEMVTENPSLILSERLKFELLSLIDKGSKVQADEGANDDLTMAYAFCCFVRKNYNQLVETEEQIKGMENYETEDMIGTISELNGFSKFSKVNTEEEYKRLKLEYDRVRKIDPTLVNPQDAFDSMFKELFSRF